MKLLDLLNLANRELRKELGKDTTVLGRAQCCMTCTLSRIDEDKYKHFIAWKIFSSGMNKDIEEFQSGKRNHAYACWDLTDEQLDKTIAILSKYFKTIRPENASKCIEIRMDYRKVRKFEHKVGE